ncbi:MAG: hypothetical protein U0V70_15700 [Terriglobia bacterium]
MEQVEINGTNLPISPSIQTWQDLLLELETKHIGEREIIASVRFDGNEILEFRDRAILDRSLQSIGEVRIQAILLEEMVKQAILDAENYLVSLQTAMVDTAETFRLRQLDEANDKLSQVLQGIKMFVALLQGIELSLRSSNRLPGERISQLLNGMAPTLEGLIESQTHKDWILVADILEFELLANLAGFEESIAEFKQAMQ